MAARLCDRAPASAADDPESTRSHPDLITMRSPNDLRKFVNEAAALLARNKDLAAFEVYASTAEHRVARLNYTSDIPSRGLEEFKSLNADGFMIRIVMRRDAHEIGSASTAGDLSLDAVRDALSRARRSLIVDPHFPGFATEPRKLGTARAVAASDLIRVNDGVLAKAAWQIVGGAIAAFEKRAPLKLAHPRPYRHNEFVLRRYPQRWERSFQLVG
jgi:hypothetical protein